MWLLCKSLSIKEDKKGMEGEVGMYMFDSNLTNYELKISYYHRYRDKTCYEEF